MSALAMDEAARAAHITRRLGNLKMGVPSKPFLFNFSYVGQAFLAPSGSGVQKC